MNSAGNNQYNFYVIQNDSVVFKDFNSKESFSDKNCLIFVFYQKELQKLEDLLFSLDEDENLRYQQFYFNRDKYNFLLGRFCVKSVVKIFYHLPLNEIHILQKDIHSKPYLNLPGIRFFFSISHTSDVVAVTISPFSEIGIDIESAIHGKGLDLIIKSYYTDNEAEVIRQSSEPEKIFKKFWTRKEAVVKLLGGQLLEQIKQIQVSENTFTLNRPLTSTQPENIYLYSFELKNGIEGCLATVNYSDQIELFIINQERLTKWAEILSHGFTQ